jgi:3-oxoacyl-[acyl-carrier-protein] synthase-3
MRFRRVRVAAMVAEVPPDIVSSAEIEARLAPVYERLRLAPGRLEMMTGIRERRAWPGGVRPSDIASAAGARALEVAGIPRERVGCLVHASVCRDFLEPATAAVVHHRLGLPRTAQFFDLSNACLGVANAMLVTAGLIEAGVLEAALVVSGENGRPLLDSTIANLLDAKDAVTRRGIKTSFTSLTIGSGGAAVLLADQRLAPTSPGLVAGVCRAATEHHGLCQGGGLGGAGHQDSGVTAESVMDMRTDAEPLLVAGLALASEAWPGFLAEVGWEAGQVDRVVTHQVGRAHTRAIHDVVQVPLEAGFTTYEWLGNVGSASLPMTAALAAEKGFTRPGHKVALLGIGSGLSTVMLGVDW